MKQVEGMSMQQEAGCVMQARLTTEAVRPMVCALQEEVASQVSAGDQQGSTPSDALWTAESLAPLLELQQSMSNQFAMHFTGNRASPGNPIVGTTPGLAAFNGKDLLRLPHMIAKAAAADTI